MGRVSLSNRIRPLFSVVAGGRTAYKSLVTDTKSPQTVHSSGFGDHAAVIKGNDLSKIKGLPVVYHPAYSAPKLTPGHRFLMDKFKVLHETLLKNETIKNDQVLCPPCSAPNEPLYQVISCGNTLKMQAMASGTLMTAEIALERGLACNLGGGTHHAFPDYGSGFCIINDLAVTAKSLLNSHLVNRILVVDLDVHQGDGTAAIFAEEPRVFTLSVHCESNFPVRKQKSDLDVGLEDGTTDDFYLKRVAECLQETLNSFKPEIVLYDSGVDPHEDDPLGRLSLTSHGLFRRDMLVLDSCLAKGVPVAGVIGGGYDNDVRRVASRHSIIVEAATQIWRDYKL